MNKKLWRISQIICVALLIFCVFGFFGCNQNGQPGDSLGSDGTVGTVDDVTVADASLFADLSKLQREGAIAFAFSDHSIAASQTADGYEIAGTELKITSSGTYILSGTCADGSVTVAKETVDVFLIFNGLTLSSSKGPALTCNKASSVCVYLEQGSENFLSDPSASHEEGAALKFKSGSALVLAGEGSLWVNGNFENGIEGGAGSILRVAGGNLSVTAQKNAVTCRHSVEVNNGVLTLSAQNDALKASPSDSDTESSGNIIINGGTVTVSAVGDGIAADGLLSIFGGTVVVTTTGEVASSTNDDFGGMGGGNPARPGQPRTESNEEASSKGIKSGSAMKITGGIITVSSTDHAIHCSGETVVKGGNITLSSSAGNGISTNGNLTVSGSAQICVKTAVEGIESKQSFTVNGGRIRVLYASDDAVNLGGTVTSDDVSNHVFTVNDGYLYLYGEGDCVDSNGKIVFNGGKIAILGPSRGGNSCIDGQYGVTHAGGTVFAVSTSNGMWCEDVLGKINGEYVYHLSVGTVSAGDSISAVSSDGSLLASVQLPFSGSVGALLLTGSVEDLTDCSFVLNGTLSDPFNEEGCCFVGDLTGGTWVTPLEGTAPSGGFNPGGGDHGGGVGGGYSPGGDHGGGKPGW